MSNWLDDRLGGVTVLDDGGELPKRKGLNLVGATVADNPGEDRVDVVIPTAIGAGEGLADLTALRALTSGDRVQRQRRVVQDSGDGKPAAFVWLSDEGASVSDDSLNVIKPSDVLLASNGRWYREPQVATALQYGVVSPINKATLDVVHVEVLAYGATGDGSTNDTTAVQAAIDAIGTVAADGKGGAVRFAPGTYSVSQLSLPANIRFELDKGAHLVGRSGSNYVLSIDGANVSIEGADRNSSTITPASGTECIRFSGASPGTGTGEAQIRFANIAFRGAGAGSKVFDQNAHAITLNEGSVVFENCQIWQMGDTAIKYGPSFYYVRFVGCYFYGNFGSESSHLAACVHVGESSETLFQDCVFNANFGPSLVIESEDCWVSHCRFFGNRANADEGADIEFRPTTGGLDGGMNAVTDCHFGAENEPFNALRSRVRFYYSGDTDNCVPAVVVARNRFIDCLELAYSATRSGATVTVSITGGEVHGIPVGQTAKVVLSSGADSTYNGEFTATATSATDFTLTNAAAVAASDTGVVRPGKSHAAIRIDNPVRGLQIAGNVFWGYATLVLDGQAASVSETFGGNLASKRGAGAFYDNHVIPPIGGGAPEIFRNGGVDFTICRPGMPGLGLEAFDDRVDYVEPDGLSNLVAYSEAINSWTASGVTVATGQTDARGGTTACKLTRAGSGGIEHVRIPVDTSGGATAYAIEFEAKADTASSLQIGWYDADVGTTVLVAGSFVGNLETFELGSGWKRYRMVVRGVTAAHNNQLRIYPVSVDVLTGAIILGRVHVTPLPGRYGYVATAGAVVQVNSTVGLNLDRLVQSKGIYPSADATHDLGLSSNAWRQVFTAAVRALSGNTLTLGDANTDHMTLADALITALVAVQFNGSVKFDALTASKVLALDGSKNATVLGYGSSDVASDLVQRDGSGNFSANTVQLDGSLKVAGVADLAGGSGVIGIVNCGAAPSGTPGGGGVLYVESGVLKYKGPSGTVTPIAPA